TSPARWATSKSAIQPPVSARAPRRSSLDPARAPSKRAPRPPPASRYSPSPGRGSRRWTSPSPRRDLRATDVARMVPFPMLPTASSAERRLYEGFLDQLSEEYVVFHSVDWVLGPRRPGEGPIQGEADFVIAHPVDGILVLEAKGGNLAFDPATGRWTQ